MNVECDSRELKSARRGNRFEEVARRYQME